MSTAKKPLNTYENRMIGVLSLTFGVVFFDRQAMNFLAPFVQADLGLTNTQVGILATGLALTWALSGVIFGRLCDRIGRQRLVLITSIVVFSLASVLSGLASSFVMLLGRTSADGTGGRAGAANFASCCSAGIDAGAARLQHGRNAAIR